MVKFILIQLIFISLSFAQEESPTSTLSLQLSKLKELKVEQDFDETYRPLSLEIERLLDLKRAECAEMAGQKSEKQLCFREVVNVHLDYIKRSFDLKLDYLKLLHSKQMSALEEAKKKTILELERQF